MKDGPLDADVLLLISTSEEPLTARTIYYHLGITSKVSLSAVMGSLNRLVRKRALKKITTYVCDEE